MVEWARRVVGVLVECEVDAEEAERGVCGRREEGRASTFRVERADASESLRESAVMSAGREGSGAECHGGQSVGEKTGESCLETAAGASKVKFSNMVVMMM